MWDTVKGFASGARDWMSSWLKTDDEGRIAYDRVEASKERLKTSLPRPAFLPWYDPGQNLEETPTMRAAFRKMLADPAVKAPFLQKVFGVISQPLTVSPPSGERDHKRAQEMAEFAQWVFTVRISEGWTGLGWDILSGLLIDGYSLTEPVFGDVITFGRWKGLRPIVDIKPKDPDRDFVPILDAYRNIVAIQGRSLNAGKIYDPKDFLIVKHLGLYGNPLGMSDLRAAYGCYWMLDTCRKLRAVAGQKFAGPVVAGKYPDNNAAMKSTMEAALAELRWQNYLAVPTSVELQVLDMVGRSADVLSKWEADLREQIGQAIIGSFLTTMTSANQNDPRGDSEVHADSASLTVWYLTQCLAKALNDHDGGLIRKLLEPNFADIWELPTANIGNTNMKGQKEQLDIDSKLEQMGFKQSIDDYERRYGRKFETDPKKQLQSPMSLMGGSGATPLSPENGNPQDPQEGNVEDGTGSKAPDKKGFPKSADIESKPPQKPEESDPGGQEGRDWSRYVGPRGGKWRVYKDGRRYHDLTPVGMSEPEDSFEPILVGGTVAWVDRAVDEKTQPV